MKKVFLLLFMMMFTTLSFANDATFNFSREKKVFQYINREDDILASIDTYIRETGDLTPTREEIQRRFNRRLSLYDNYANNSCDATGSYCTDNSSGGVSINFNRTTRKVELANTLGDSPNSFVANFYNTYERERVTTDSSTSTLIYTLSAETLKVVKIIEKILANDPDAHIGDTAPSDNSKTWYQVNEDGGVDVKKHDGTDWRDMGSTSGNGNGKIYADTEAELFDIPCLAGDSGFVGKTTDKQAIPYTCIADNTWKKIAGSTTDSKFSGEATILEIITDFYDAEGESKARATAPNMEFSGQKTFFKLSNASTGGYWVTETNDAVVAQKMEQISYQGWGEGTNAFLPNHNNTRALHLKMTNVPSIGLRWVFIADTLDEVVQNYKNISTLHGGLVYSKDKDKYFVEHNEVWTSLDNLIQATGSTLGRLTFSLLNNTYTYYVLEPDCDSMTCNGTSSATDYYAGVKDSNMFVFRYATSGKRKNSLSDSIPRNTIAEMYDNNDASSILISTGELFSREMDSRNRVVYKSESGLFYTRSGVEIPNELIISGKVNLPPSYSATTANIVSGAVALTNVDELDAWTDAPDLAKVVISGTILTHNTSSGLDFWTDNNNGDGQAYATVLYALARSTAPLITHSGVKVYTKGLCAYNLSCPKNNGQEDRYTDNGIIVSSGIFANRYEWFYSLSGITTNNLLDGYNKIIGSDIIRREIVGWNNGSPIVYFTIRNISNDRIEVYLTMKNEGVSTNDSKKYISINYPTQNFSLATNGRHIASFSYGGSIGYDYTIANKEICFKAFYLSGAEFYPDSFCKRLSY